MAHVEHQTCIKACEECAEACEHYATACLGEGDVKMMAECIGLVPLALGKGQTGKEILHPLAVVVIGGLVTSTLLDQIVTSGRTREHAPVANCGPH
jgi:hypothetical protein